MAKLEYLFAARCSSNRPHLSRKQEKLWEEKMCAIWASRVTELPQSPSVLDSSLWKKGDDNVTTCSPGKTNKLTSITPPGSGCWKYSRESLYFLFTDASLGSSRGGAKNNRGRGEETRAIRRKKKKDGRWRGILFWKPAKGVTNEKDRSERRCEERCAFWGRRCPLKLSSFWRGL